MAIPDTRRGFDIEPSKDEVDVVIDRAPLA
jgi:hypothetical protein